MSVSSIISSDTIYSILIEDASPTVTYIGEAAIGSDTSAPVWRIKRIQTTGSLLAIDWADKNSRFDNVWDNRDVLSY